MHYKLSNVIIDARINFEIRRTLKLLKSIYNNVLIQMIQIIK